MSNNIFHRWMSATAAALAIASMPAVAQAQYEHDPFFENTILQSQAYGLEMIGVRLTLAETFAAPIHDDLLEQFEKAAGRDFDRFAGTLGAEHPEFTEELHAALLAVIAAAEEGEDTAAAAVHARTLLAEAYALLIPEEVRDSPAFKGAVLADLLLADDGVAEALEDALEDEEWEYPNGWSALQRVKELWAEIEGLASENNQEYARELLAILDGIYPRAEPPESFVGIDPEEAEAPTQILVSIIETSVNADLFPGRDLARLSDHLVATTRSACTAYADDLEAIGLEGIYAVRNLYRKHLRRLIGLFDPEVNANAERLLDTLVGLTEHDGEGAAPSAAGQCGELLESLIAGGTVLGG